MTKTKTTKRALIASVLSLLLCVSMLIGSTFAWFTDTATTGVNTIKSGNLDVDLVNEKGVSVANGTLNFVDKDDNIYWEPGCTYTLENVYVENKGNLALKYQIKVTGIVGDAKLLEAIEWTMNGFDMDTEYSLEAGQKSTALSITAHMKETADNDYENLELNGIAITVYATQYTSEYDSWNNTYDKNAKYDDAVTKPDNLTSTPKTAAELKTILTTALTGGSVEGVITVNLENDFNLNNEWEVIPGANYSGVNKVVINGNGHKITNLNVPLLSGVFGGYEGALEINGITIADSTVTGDGWGVAALLGAADSTNKLIINDCHLNNVTVNGTASGGVGGFVGASSAATVTVTNCSTTGLTVNSDTSAGALFGLCQSNLTVTGCSFADTTLTSTDDGQWRIGLIGGTLNASSTVTVTNATESNTVLTQANGSANPIQDNTNAAISKYFGRIYKTISINGSEYTATSN